MIKKYAGLIIIVLGVVALLAVIFFASRSDGGNIPKAKEINQSPQEYINHDWAFLQGDAQTTKRYVIWNIFWSENKVNKYTQLNANDTVEALKLHSGKYAGKYQVTIFTNHKPTKLSNKKLEWVK